MIGIAVKESEKNIAKEFFELFKTPWEFYTDTRSYDVVISTDHTFPKANANLVIIYGSEKTDFDHQNNVQIESETKGSLLQYGKDTLPVYGKMITFAAMGAPLTSVKGKNKIVGFEDVLHGRKVCRVGFDLFQEIKFLLSVGQSSTYALYPTLELHISMIRSMILQNGIPIVEIPPTPAECDFIVCLTHDVDFVGIHRHRFDHTFFGFLFRASFLAFVNFLRRRISFRKMLKNWEAVLSLPGIYLGNAKDFWYLFDQYIEIEKGLGSTFFMIPSKGNPGEGALGFLKRARAVNYEIKDITREVRKLIESGCEIGLHGIDAWKSVQKGMEERKQISSITGSDHMGVRMHWLYYDGDSPEILDATGFFYDSTFAYNDAIGFRAGTTQVFRPLNAKKILELPLLIQDTALLSYGRMNLSENRALKRAIDLIAIVERYGGVATINWHHRSLGPERFWDDIYITMLKDLKMRNVWFSTGTQIAQWFHKRRSLVFHSIDLRKNQLHVNISTDRESIGPDLCLRVYKPIGDFAAGSAKDKSECVDLAFSSELNGVFDI